jgi:hypothetical protein
MQEDERAQWLRDIAHDYGSHSDQYAYVREAVQTARGEEIGKGPDVMVTVCAECRRASCWYAEFFCDNARTANIVDVPRSVLLAERRESPHYLSDEYIEKVTGDKPQPARNTNTTGFGA